MESMADRFTERDGNVLVFEDDGSIREYIGSYSDWARRGKGLAEMENPNEAAGRASKIAAARDRKLNKLSYKQQRELEEIPGQIEALEQAIQALQDQIATPDFYGQGHDEVQVVLEKLAGKNTALDTAVERWAKLEEMHEALQKSR